MFKRIQVILILTVALLLASSTQVVQAQNPVESTWQASYWNNIDLAGPPVLERSEANVNYDWGRDSPAPEINADSFSARWSRSIDLEAGVYRFTATSDDGIRVWVDNNLIIDRWNTQSVRTVTVDRELNEGLHQIRVEYFEDRGEAVVQLVWNPIATDEIRPVWKAEYFANANLSGDPQLVREDPQINFNWANGSPAPEIGDDNFSVRWSRLVDLPAGTYRFTMTVDDGARLWVDDQLLIDAWYQQAATQHVEEIELSGGLIPVRMEYFEQTGFAVARLEWERVVETDEPPQPELASQATPSEPVVLAQWRGDYYDNQFLLGDPVAVRTDEHINFNWGDEAPDIHLIRDDNFSVRWRKTVNVPAGPYCFVMTVDDGGRLLVNNRPLLEAWTVQPASSYVEKIDLPAGATSITMEYFENSGQAAAQLVWGQINPRTTSATGYIDDRQVGFVPDNFQVVKQVQQICRQPGLVAVQ